jgi:hypothetical protein
MDSAPFEHSVRLASALLGVAQGCKCCLTGAAYTLMSISVGAKWPPCYRLNTSTTQVEHKMSQITDLSKQIYPEGTKRTTELKRPQLQGICFVQVTNRRSRLNYRVQAHILLKERRVNRLDNIHRALSTALRSTDGTRYDVGHVCRKSGRQNM